MIAIEQGYKHEIRADIKDMQDQIGLWWIIINPDYDLAC